MFVVLAALAVLWLALWLARRGRHSPAPEPHAFTRAEIAGYDRALPKYLLAAAFSLLLGGLHGLVVQLPGVRTWLFLSGQPARLVVDEVSEQLVVVGGAVMLTMGLTCYALPRLTGRPLRNHNLARASFVLTLAGVLLTALMTASIGLSEAIAVHNGATYAQAQARLGAWGRLPLWLAQGARDVGYWTFALLIILTVHSGRPVIWPRHRRRLTYWLVASAVGFFLVVVQRVLQQYPGNPLLSLDADEATLLISYRGYVHLHLCGSALLPLAAATFIYLLERKAERRSEWHRVGRLLGGLAVAAGAFYLVHLGFGLYEAGIAPRLDPQALLLGAAWRNLLLILANLGALAALFGYLVYAIRLARAARGYLPGAIIGTLVVSMTLALLGGLHGAVLSLLPLGPPSAASQAHGTLMLGAALLLPALTLADSLLIDAAGAGPTASLAHAGLGFLGAGIVLAYLARLGLGGPAGNLIAAALQFAGFLTFALHTLHATGDYRHALRGRLRFLRPAAGPPSQPALLELPRSQVLLIELLAALAGFPGFGWLFGGFTLPGALLLYIGPGVAWALLPSLFALSGGWLHRLGWSTLLLYLPTTAIASTLVLRRALRRQEAEATTEEAAGAEVAEE